MTESNTTTMNTIGEIYADHPEVDHAIRSQDEAELAATLALLPVDWEAFRIAMHARADQVDASEPTDPARIRLDVIAAIMASAVPGETITETFASAIDHAMTLWYSLSKETPEQRATREAFTEARRLIDLHGDTDHRAMRAILHAVDLADPGFTDRALAECGITLPAPTHCTKDGEPLFSLEAIADALGADADDLAEIAVEMEDAGLNVRQVAAGRLQ